MSTPTEKDIERVVRGYDRAKSGADYADTIVLEMQNVEGETYVMRWSNVYYGNFVSSRE